MDYSDLFQVDATLVANEFLDSYMPKANGEYVKVYLYLLRNRVGGIDISTIAENLALTEGDVRRALKYWEAEGILTRGASAAGKAKRKEAEAEFAHAEAKDVEAEAGRIKKAAELEEERNDKAKRKICQGGAAAEKESKAGEMQAQNEREKEASAEEQALLDREELRRSYKRASGAAKLDALSKDAEFAQLLFVVQKYMSKILSERDEQVFAYLYDGLKMPCDVLEYLVEYCVQTGHSSMRYIETVGLDWATAGIRDAEAAKRRTKQFEQSREESGKRRTARKNKLGVTRGTDYNTVFSDRSNLILEQVIRKQMEQ